VAISEECILILVAIEVYLKIIKSSIGMTFQIKMQYVKFGAEPASRGYKIVEMIGRSD
jgi:hypothetical protein